MPLNSLFRILSLSSVLTDTLCVQNKNIFWALQKRDNNNYGENSDNGLEKQDNKKDVTENRYVDI